MGVLKARKTSANHTRSRGKYGGKPGETSCKKTSGIDHSRKGEYGDSRENARRKISRNKNPDTQLGETGISRKRNTGILRETFLEKKHLRYTTRRQVDVGKTWETFEKETN